MFVFTLQLLASAGYLIIDFWAQISFWQSVVVRVVCFKLPLTNTSMIVMNARTTPKVMALNENLFFTSPVKNLLIDSTLFFGLGHQGPSNKFAFKSPKMDFSWTFSRQKQSYFPR